MWFNPGGGALSPNIFRFMLTDLKVYLDNQNAINLLDQLFVHLLWADALVLMSDTPQWTVYSVFVHVFR